MEAHHCITLLLVGTPKQVLVGLGTIVLKIQ
jgi:hypothetical protein